MAVYGNQNKTFAQPAGLEFIEISRPFLDLQSNALAIRPHVKWTTLKHNETGIDILF